MFGACDHAALRIVREAFLAHQPDDWSFQEAVEMMRVAWAADVRRGLVGSSAWDGGVASAVFLCIKCCQTEGERTGRYSRFDTDSTAPRHHDNATMVLMQLAFKSDDPSVLGVLYQWTPDWRIRKAFLRGIDGRGENQGYYVSSSGEAVSARSGNSMLPVGEGEEFAEDYTYEMAENHPGSCPRCVRWLRKRNETARTVFKARRAANLETKRACEAQNRAAGHEAAQAAFEEMCERHDQREAAVRAEANASERERARRIATERERRQQAATEGPGVTLPGPSHREPRSLQTALRELGMEEQVAKQQWKEDRANRAAQAEEKQRSAHDSATARKQKEKALKERQEQARRAMAMEDAARMRPPPLTLADYVTES